MIGAKLVDWPFYRYNAKPPSAIRRPKPCTSTFTWITPVFGHRSESTQRISASPVSAHSFWSSVFKNSTRRTFRFSLTFLMNFGAFSVPWPLLHSCTVCTNINLSHFFRVFYLPWTTKFIDVHTGKRFFLLFSQLIYSRRITALIQLICTQNGTS